MSFLKERLTAMNIKYQLWQNGEITAVLTATISDSTFKALTQELTLAAYYQIEGE